MECSTPRPLGRTAREAEDALRQLDSTRRALRAITPLLPVVDEIASPVHGIALRVLADDVVRRASCGVTSKRGI